VSGSRPRLPSTSTDAFSDSRTSPADVGAAASSVSTSGGGATFPAASLACDSQRLPRVRSASSIESSSVNPGGKPNGSS
jgi:hypothetical protein